jgi:hypothetical protein
MADANHVQFVASYPAGQDLFFRGFPVEPPLRACFDEWSREWPLLVTDDEFRPVWTERSPSPGLFHSVRNQFTIMALGRPVTRSNILYHSTAEHRFHFRSVIILQSL